MDIKKIYEKTLKNGGLTLTSNCENEVSFSKGYQVAFEGGYIFPCEEYDSFSQAIIGFKNKFSYVGTWLNEGLIYIDPSEYAPTFAEVVEIARPTQELACFDWSTFKSVPFDWNSL